VVRFPPQGSVLPELRSLFSSRVKTSDTAPYDCVKIKPLIDAGFLTIGDLAGFINGVGAASEWANYLRAWYYIYGADFVAQLLNNTNLSASRIADIVNNAALLANELKTILANANLSADRVQAILYMMIDAGYYDRLINLMTFDVSDVTISFDTTWSSGVNRYRNITINSNITLTLNTLPNVILADTIVNGGTITVATRPNGGASTYGSGAGGGGAQGLIVLARTVTVGTVNANAAPGSYGASPSVSSSGKPGGAGSLWVISGYPGGNGGAGNGASNVDCGAGGGGGGQTGGAGGSSITGPGGDGGSASVTTFSTAADMLKEVLKSVADWYIRNVLSKTPTTTKSIPNLYGSGGGSGGAASGTDSSGGGGGGSGGEVIIFGVTVNAGTVNATGGAGGSGYGVNGYAGGGGGGGLVYVFYKTLNGTFTFNVAGGSGAYSGTSGSAVAFAV